MSDKQQHYPLLFIAACIMVVAGITSVVAAVILQPEKHIYKGLILLGVALLNFGGGEILNHPKMLAEAEDGTVLADQPAVRRRNSCGLGNLMDIVGLLMFFIAVSSFVYER